MAEASRPARTSRWATALAVTGYTVSFVARVLPHPWNVTPLGASAAFAAAHQGLARSTAGVLLTMAASDLVLWLTRYRAAGFPLVTTVTPFVYVGWFGYLLLGRWLARRAGLLGPAVALLGGSAWFFLVSNFGVWFAGYYPATAQGLMACYAAAIPFWRQMLLADLFFGVILFGSYAAVVGTAGQAEALSEPVQPANNS